MRLIRPVEPPADPKWCSQCGGLNPCDCWKSAMTSDQRISAQMYVLNAYLATPVQERMLLRILRGRSRRNVHKTA